mmetsp:Transcript_64617/g.179719  ORF Transcript_64617/g.179719 Transcript_64617/m.179719 type:complete len:241 (-) Transcript_64617:1-723(-)
MCDALIVMPRLRSSGALSISSYDFAFTLASWLKCDMESEIAADSVVFPWSTWPTVPRLMWSLARLATAAARSGGTAAVPFTAAPKRPASTALGLAPAKTSSACWAAATFHRLATPELPLGKRAMALSATKPQVANAAVATMNAAGQDLKSATSFAACGNSTSDATTGTVEPSTGAGTDSRSFGTAPPWGAAKFADRSRGSASNALAKAKKASASLLCGRFAIRAGGKTERGRKVGAARHA